MRNPTVIIPYKGPDCSGKSQDIFLYLRPESNGVLVESTLMGVLRGNREYREGAELIYLANLPGDFIMKNHVIEEHYSINYCFACKGGELFTPYMRTLFSNFFSVDCEHARIIGSFEALDVLGLSEEELFNLWVPNEKMTVIHGQSVKKIDGVYIINYDIPALLHKNNYSTDIAVMILRSSMEKERFPLMIRDMEEALVLKGVMDGEKPPSRYFHYSKGPFEQILDGMGYLYAEGGEHLPLENVSFASKLLSENFTLDQIRGILRNPIMSFNSDLEELEENIFIKTKSMSFNESLDVLRSARYQVYIK